MSHRPIEEKLDRQLKFHRTEWRIQRIGWIFLSVFLALALAGLFGNGPLSHTRVAGPQGRIEYQRFVRYGSPSELVITPASGAARGISRVEITAEYLEGFRIESVTPEPTTVRMSGQQLVYEFAAAGAGASISFDVDPQRLWRHRALVRIDGGEALEIRQLTYP
ncbi:MAG TPA: hypothetical protein VJQ52_00510 [Steroidobacteraceae bacterium]|nr:hypothetical protein [Steroidobacteraceae bacterium]